MLPTRVHGHHVFEQLHSVLQLCEWECHGWSFNVFCRFVARRRSASSQSHPSHIFLVYRHRTVFVLMKTLKSATFQTLFQPAILISAALSSHLLRARASRAARPTTPADCPTTNASHSTVVRMGNFKILLRFLAVELPNSSKI